MCMRSRVSKGVSCDMCKCLSYFIAASHTQETHTPHERADETLPNAARRARAGGGGGARRREAAGGAGAKTHLAAAPFCRCAENQRPFLRAVGGARDEPVGHRRDAVTFTPLQLRSCPTSSSSSGHPCRSGAVLALGALLRRGAASLHLYGGRLCRETQQNVMEIDSEGVRAHASVQPRHPSP